MRHEDKGEGKGRLLLITYHFPPSREVGAVRWQQLAKFAVGRGWSLDVVTLDPAQVNAPDWTAMSSLPAEVRVHGVAQRALPIDRLVQRLVALRRRLRTRIRGQDKGDISTGTAPRRPAALGIAELRSPFHSPRDAVRAFHAWRAFVRQRHWARRATAVAHNLLKAGPYSAVITCGPPHMVHHAGWQLQRRTGIPFVMDMRDPWSLSPRLQEPIASPIGVYIARFHERRVVPAAALIVANTEQSCAGMQSAYPALRDRVIAIWNGYDDDAPPRAERREGFVIAYAGSIYLDRDPQPLFRAAALVIRGAGVTPARFRLEFMGGDADTTGMLSATAQQEGIAPFVRAYPARSRAEAQLFLSHAAMLVSLPLVSLSPEVDTSIPAKLFEYARFDAWLLALAKPGSATAQLLAGTGADVVAPDDVEGIAAVMRARYAAFAAGVRPAAIRLPERFSRRVQAERLFDEIERRLAGAAQASPQ